MKNFVKLFGKPILYIFVWSFILMFLVEHIVWLNIKIFLWLKVIVRIVFILDVIIIFPLGIFKKTKTISAIGLIISSTIYFLYLWCWSFLFTYSIWGIIGVSIGLSSAIIGIIPAAILAAVVTGKGIIAGQIVLYLVVSIIPSILGATFLYQEKQDDVIQDNYPFIIGIGL